MYSLCRLNAVKKIAVVQYVHSYEIHTINYFGSMIPILFRVGIVFGLANDVYANLDVEYRVLLGACHMTSFLRVKTSWNLTRKRIIWGEGVSTHRLPVP